MISKLDTAVNPIGDRVLGKGVELHTMYMNKSCPLDRNIEIYKKGKYLVLVEDKEYFGDSKISHKYMAKIFLRKPVEEITDKELKETKDMFDQATLDNYKTQTSEYEKFFENEECWAFNASSKYLVVDGETGFENKIKWANFLRKKGILNGIVGCLKNTSLRPMCEKIIDKHSDGDIFDYLESLAEEMKTVNDQFTEESSQDEPNKARAYLKIKDLHKGVPELLGIFSNYMNLSFEGISVAFESLDRDNVERLCRYFLEGKPETKNKKRSDKV